MTQYAIGAANWEPAGGASEGGTGSLENAVSRDSAYIGSFGMAYRKQVGEQYSFPTFPIYSGVASGGFTAHTRCAVYLARFAFRPREFPSSEYAILGISSSVNPSFAGVVTIDPAGIIHLYNYAGGTFASRVDVAAMNGQADPVMQLGVWHSCEFYIDWGEASGGGASPATPAAVALGICPVDGGSMIIEVDATYGVQLATANGLGNESAYLVNLVSFPSAGFSAPANRGEYDVDAITVVQTEQDPGIIIGGTGGYTPYPRPAQIQIFEGLTPFIAQSVIAPGSWRLEDGSALDARAFRDYGGSSVVDGAVKSSLANDPMVIQYVPPAGFTELSPSGLLVAFFTLANPGTGAATISVDGGAPLTVFPFPGTWSFVWIRAANAGSPQITLTHPNNAATMRIQNLIVGALGQPPPAPTSRTITVATGIYVGNGVAQSIACTLQPDWICVGPPNASSKGVVWWESLVSPQDWSQGKLRSAELWPTVTGFDVVGNNPQTNAIGVSYRWFAIADATRRALFRGAAASEVGIVATLGSPVTPYNRPPLAFTTAALWAMAESLTSSSNSNGGYYRGPGHTGINSSPLNATQSVNGIRSLPGATWIAGSALTQNEPQMAFTAWSITGFFTQILWDVTTYVGNGVASRTIPLVLGNYRPGWVLGVPHDAFSYIRYLGHALNLSMSAADGSTSTTALLNFVLDGVVVGIDMNQVGVVYEILAIIDPTDGAGGGGAISDVDPASLGCALNFPAGTVGGAIAGCRVNFPSA